MKILHARDITVRKVALTLTALAALSSCATASWAASPLPGAIFTTDVTCAGVNLNIYAQKTDVYLNGGPAHPGAANLPVNTSYYVQVTTPSGLLVLGSSLNNTGSQRPVSTSGSGNFSQCYQLSSIVSLVGGTPGYDDTTNPGSEYKVWVSTDTAFNNSNTKTDNFKIRPATPPPADIGKITIRKFYDRNTNGVWDADEPELPTAGLLPFGSAGWKVDLLGFPAQYTQSSYNYLPLTDYTAQEFRPIEANWIPTTPAPTSSDPTYLNKALVSLSTAVTEATLTFGNVCVGAGGGLTLGFWSNKNGQAAMTKYGMTNALGLLSTGLNLRNYDGTEFNPTSYSQFRTWLLNGNAVNMAYMLSVQLAAMEMNVFSNGVNGNALVYAPGSQNANSAGFVSVTVLMNEANISLGNDNLTWAGITARNYQEYLKTALDKANNNLTFAQDNACSYTFAP